MNSVTPISSLAGTANDLLREISPERMNNGSAAVNIKDVGEAVHTIQKRSEGLLHFVEAYRSLTRLPQPKFRKFPLSDLVKRLENLISEELNNKGINLETSITPDSLQLTADPEQIEQVLINLTQNAIQALQNTPEARIELRAFEDDQERVVIQVIDNGVGIPPDIQEKIFIPFFTTKKEGSGIGLSLSRQIIRLHRGTISVNSEVDSGTIFTIKI
jgi:signal transduction histidine kinase